jgi:biotin synthase-like enzyme
MMPRVKYCELKPLANDRVQTIRQTTKEGISTCATSMTGFFHHWTDAMPKTDLFEF